MGGIALQLYTVRELAQADFERTLRELADAGYERVELAGLHDADAERARGWLDAAGLGAMGAHVPWERFEQEAEAVAAELDVLGCEWAVVPSLPASLHGFEGVAAAASTLGVWAARCESAGLRLAYHNHDYELRRRDSDGVTLLERLLDATDERVALELDVFWAAVGGVDPRRLLECYGPRVRLLHVKDRGGGDRDAPFGEGTLPWDEILPAARSAGVEWYIVEQDVPSDALRDAATALQNLQHALSA